MALFDSIPAYAIFSTVEINRKSQINELINAFPSLIKIDAIFPSKIKVPFLNNIINKSFERTGRKLFINEVGVLLSHRLVWTSIVKNNTPDNIHYLILESDSKILNYQILSQNFDFVQNNYDCFFWGAWNGHSSIKKSTITRSYNNFKIGEPIIDSVYGAYGYSINSKTAKYMLQKTNKVAYPVDIYKRFLSTTDIKIGTILPAIIGTWLNTKSNIKDENLIDLLYRYIIMKILSIRNNFIAYFS
jgi:GR25 family glycosyltransferase involved in LPS biosynthesis